MPKTQFKNEVHADIPMYRTVARGHKRKLITYITTKHDLDDIGVPAGSTGKIQSKRRGGIYDIVFDNPSINDASLTVDEFTVVKQTLDMSKNG